MCCWPADRSCCARPFLLTWNGTNCRPASLNWGVSLFVMHSPIDDTVDIHNAGQIFLAAKHPKSFISLDDPNHHLREPSAEGYAARLIAACVSHDL